MWFKIPKVAAVIFCFLYPSNCCHTAHFIRYTFSHFRTYILIFLHHGLMIRPFSNLIPFKFCSILSISSFFLVFKRNETAPKIFLESAQVLGSQAPQESFRLSQYLTPIGSPFTSLLVSDTKHTVMKRSACCDILYQNIHFLFILCSLSRQLSGNVSDQGRYASSNSGWFRWSRSGRLSNK